MMMRSTNVMTEEKPFDAAKCEAMPEASVKAADDEAVGDADSEWAIILRAEDRVETVKVEMEKLIEAIDAVEFAYRRGLSAIREGGKEHPLFAELFRAADDAKEYLTT
jgi:hypothetical protein